LVKLYAIKGLDLPGKMIWLDFQRFSVRICENVNCRELLSLVVTWTLEPQRGLSPTPPWATRDLERGRHVVPDFYGTWLPLVYWQLYSWMCPLFSSDV
jgi:hypothetical protein